MALDSQVKRMAAAGVGRPYMRATLANSVNAAQRSSISNSYPVAVFATPGGAVSGLLLLTRPLSTFGGHR